MSYPKDLPVPDMVRCPVCNVSIRIPVKGVHSAWIQPSPYIGATVTYPCHRCNGTVDLFIRDDGRIGGARYRDVKGVRTKVALDQVMA